MTVDALAGANMIDATGLAANSALLTADRGDERRRAPRRGKNDTLLGGRATTS